VLLEGEMGAGKTTFARAVLQGLGVVQPPEGSPTFAIAHEYVAPGGPVAHIDLYRIKHESELEDAGIHHYFWEREMRVLCEWVSLWPGLWSALTEEPQAREARTWIVRILMAEGGDPALRDIEIRLR
jgi:tRNA threonylcarbamoyladenosine biosynthesis protein TsaE